MNGVTMWVSEPFKVFFQEIQKQRKKLDRLKPKSKISFTELSEISLEILQQDMNVDKLLTKEIH